MTPDTLDQLDRARVGDPISPAWFSRLRADGLIGNDGLPTCAGLCALRNDREGYGPAVTREQLDEFVEVAA